MSYARFGWDGSDVYVFASVSGHMECCGCSLEEEMWSYDTVDDLVEHLREHVAAGETVPDETFEALAAERDELEEWLREERS